MNADKSRSAFICVYLRPFVFHTLRRRSIARSRPIATNTTNAPGPTGWPVSAARAPLINSPAFTPRSSASLRSSASEFGSGGEASGQLSQERPRIRLIQLFQRVRLDAEIVGEVGASTGGKIFERDEPRSDHV